MGSYHTRVSIFAVSSTLTVAIGGSPDFTLAQIIPDTSLGRESSQLVPGTLIQGAPGDRIDGGATRGTNLFHSFQEFNVGSGQRVYFANPVGIQTIFSRVTGGKSSNLLGTLGVDGNASLFLLNPQGIFFGPQARLDIRGSFLASTADRILFADGSEFTATPSPTNSLLTFSVPLGVQYGTSSGLIQSQGHLAVGQDLTLAADNLELQGQLRAGNDLSLQAQNRVEIRDSATQAFTAIAGKNLLVQGNHTLDIVALSHPGSGLQAGGDLILRSGNTVNGDAHFQAGGRFRVEQLTGELGNLYSPQDPVILTSGNVELGNYTGASLHILAGGSVTLGNVTITGSDTTGNAIGPSNSLSSFAGVTLSNGTRLTVDGATQATLDIRAGIDWSQLGGFLGEKVLGSIPNPQPAFPLSSFSPTSATIQIGSITNSENAGARKSGQVLITNQYYPNLNLPGGDITVASILTSPNQNSLTAGINNGGNITIDSRSNLSLNGPINTSVDTSSSSSSAGEVFLQAGQNIFLNGSIDTSADSTSGSLQANGGDVDIEAGGNILLTSDSDILTRGVVSGFVRLAGGGTITLQSSTIDTTTGSGSGNAGSIWLQGSKVTLSNGSLLDAATQGRGNAGSVTVTGTESVIFDNSEAVSRVTSSGQGLPSDVSISALQGTIQILNGSRLSASSSFAGAPAGNITLTARDRVVVANSRISSRSVNEVSEDVGVVQITAQQGSVLLDGATITTANTGLQFAGDIFVNARDRIDIVRGSEITAEGVEGGIFLGASSEIVSESPLVPQTVVVDSSKLLTVNAINADTETGDILINALGSIQLTNATLSGDGNQGRIFLGFRSADEVDPVLPQNIVILHSNLTTDNGVIRGEAAAGSINLRSSNRIDIAQNSVLSGVTDGKAAGGNININTRSLAVTNGSTLDTTSDGAGRAGNINISARRVILDNGARIQADTESGNGGNITLQDMTVLVLRRDSLISTEAGSSREGGGGNGGNITLNARKGFIVAVARENSDIIANAFDGRGGQVKIAANRVLGLTVQRRLSTDSLRSNRSSDVSASSEVGSEGNVDIDSLQIDPSQGLISLPVDLIDPTNLIARGCDPGNETSDRQSRFIATGKGGLPANPFDSRSAGAPPIPWVSRTAAVVRQEPPSPSLDLEAPSFLAEAQGIAIDPHGDIFLTAHLASSQAQPSGQPDPHCRKE